MERTNRAFFVLAQRRIYPKHLDEFLEIDDALMRDASRTPGFGSVYVLQSLEEPNFVSHFEVWDSQEAHDRFVMESAHQDFEEKIDPFVEYVHDPRHYTLFHRYASDRPTSSQNAFTDGAERFAPAFADDEPAGSSRWSLQSWNFENSVEKILKKLPPLRFFRVVAHAETAFAPFLRLADALLNQGNLHPRLREIAILAIAYLEKSDYERVQHEALARDLGITSHQIEAIHQGNFEAPILNDDERLVLRFVQAWWSEGVVSDALFEAAAERFESNELVELLLICGFYLMAARLMINAGLVPEEPPGEQFQYS